MQAESRRAVPVFTWGRGAAVRSARGPALNPQARPSTPDLRIRHGVHAFRRVPSGRAGREPDACAPDSRPAIVVTSPCARRTPGNGADGPRATPDPGPDTPSTQTSHARCSSGSSRPPPPRPLVIDRATRPATGPALPPAPRDQATHPPGTTAAPAQARRVALLLRQPQHQQPTRIPPGHRPPPPTRAANEDTSELTRCANMLVAR